MWRDEEQYKTAQDVESEYRAASTEEQRCLDVLVEAQIAHKNARERAKAAFRRRGTRPWASKEEPHVR